MVDLKKELSFSDLVPKLPAKKPKPVSAAATKRRPMPPEVVGLKIEAAGVTAAHVVNNGSRRLVQLVRTPLQAGIVGSGEVRDPAGLAAALNEFFTAHDLPRRGIRLGLANTRIGVRIIEVGGVSDLPQLENAISFRAHEILSVPLDEAVIDYHILSTSTGEDGAVSYRILLVVAYKDSVDRYLAATDTAGLEVAGIDLDAFALLRALPLSQVEAGSEAPNADELNVEGPTAVAAVSIDHDLTTLAITDGTTCQFTRVLEWGTANVDVALCRTLKVTADRAVELRRDLSLEHVSNTYSGGPGVTPEPADVVRRELQTLLRELVSSIRFYGSQEGVPPVRSLVFSGWLVDVPGLVARLGADLGVTVSAADPFGRVETSHDFERLEGSAGVLVAVGLGIED
jgi:type IV pilus assembly protein PilM